LLAPACPIEKVTLSVDLLSGSETDDGVAKDEGFLPKLEVKPTIPGENPSALSTKLSLHPTFPGGDKEKQATQF